MGFPYGANLLSFLDRYDQAERTSEVRRRGELQEALALRQVSELDRQRREEESVMGALAQEVAARRAQPALPSGISTTVAAGAPIPGAEAALEAGVVQPGVTNVPNIQNTAGLFPTPTPRQPFGASLPPEQAVRVLGHPRAQAVIRSVEQAEKDQEAQRLKEEARQLFGVATERFRGQDATGGYEELAKAYNRMGLHGEAGRALEHAISLRQDKEDEEKTNTWLGDILKAEKAFTEDPSFATHGAFLEALGAGTSKTAKALRLQLIGNQIKATLSRDPFSAILWKKMNEKYAAAWEKGESPSFEAVVKDLQKENPGLLLRALGDELEKGKELPKAVLKVMGVGEEVDPAKLKDFTSQAFQNFRVRTGRGPRTEDEFNAVWKEADRLAASRKKAEAEADPTKKELDDLRLKRARYDEDVRQGKVEPNLNQLTIFRDRAHRIATSLDSAPEDQEAAGSEERYWSQRIAEQIKKQPAGKELGKPKAGSPAALLGGRKFADLAEEEKQGLLLAQAKLTFPAKVKTFEDLGKLSPQERARLKAELDTLEASGGGRP